MVILNNSSEELNQAPSQQRKSPLVKQKSEGSLVSRPAFSFSSSKTSMYESNYSSLSMKSSGDESTRRRVPKMSKGSRKLVGYELLPRKKLVLSNGSTGVGAPHLHHQGGTSSSSSSNNSIGIKASKQAKLASGNLDDDDDDEGYDIVYDSTKEDGIALPATGQAPGAAVQTTVSSTSVSGPSNTTASFYTDSTSSPNLKHNG